MNYGNCRHSPNTICKSIEEKVNNKSILTNQTLDTFLAGL